MHHRVLFSALMLLLFLPGGFAAQSLRFEHIGVEEGLSQQQVSAILQDRKGFMWFGSLGGLDRYDGYEIKQYQHDPDDPSTLSSSWVDVIFEDRDGDLWIGGKDGLNRMDADTGKITRYLHDPAEPNSLSNNSIRAIVQDSDGYLWIATERGLNRLDIDTHQFKPYSMIPTNRPD